MVRSNETLTTLGVKQLVKYAHSGLPVIFSGGLPSNFSGYNPSAAAKAIHSLNEIKSLKNVHIVGSDNLASNLQSLEILPRTSVASNGTWYTMWREDAANASSYIFIYNDATGLSFEEGMTSGSISFESTGVPFLYDTWSGESTPISTYNQSKTHTTIPLQLAGNQSTIIGFQRKAKPVVHIEDTTIPILPIVRKSNSLSVLRSYDEKSREVNLSTRKRISLSPMTTKPFTLRNWTLIIESWTPLQDLYNAEGQTRKNQTFHIPALVPWNQISSSLSNVSGIGYYTTEFSWPVRSSANISGAFIDLGPITHTARVTVNGYQLPTLDINWARADLGPFLRRGRNVVEVVVSTTLGNVLRNYWDEIETSGTNASGIAAVPSEEEYGLVYPVQIVPYRKDQIA